MKKLRRLFRSPLMSGLLFLLAAALLLGGAVGTTTAAPSIRSDQYNAGVGMYQIGVTLVENGADVSRRDYKPYSNYVWDEQIGALLGNMLEETKGELQLGRAYKEELSVRNSGEIDEFVRVTVLRYWMKDGEKNQTLAPEAIKLEWANLAPAGNWVHDDRSQSTTKEREVFYYRIPLGSPVAGHNECGNPSASVPFTTTLTVDADIPYRVERVEEGNTTYVKYIYDDYTFVLEATVDAVQTHNARQAIKSAWGLTDADISRFGLAVSD